MERLDLSRRQLGHRVRLNGGSRLCHARRTRREHEVPWRTPRRPHMATCRTTKATSRRSRPTWSTGAPSGWSPASFSYTAAAWSRSTTCCARWLTFPRRPQQARPGTRSRTASARSKTAWMSIFAESPSPRSTRPITPSSSRIRARSAATTTTSSASPSRPTTARWVSASRGWSTIFASTSACCWWSCARYSTRAC